MITGFEQSVQLSVFVKSIGAGFFIGILFALFSAINVINGKNTLLVCIRDALFLIISAIFTFLFALKYNAGIVRFYLLAGELIGFILCYMTTPYITRKFVLRIKKGINKIKNKKNNKKHLIYKNK